MNYANDRKIGLRFLIMLMALKENADSLVDPNNKNHYYYLLPSNKQTYHDLANCFTALTISKIHNSATIMLNKNKDFWISLGTDEFINVLESEAAAQMKHEVHNMCSKLLPHITNP